MDYDIAPRPRHGHGYPAHRRITRLIEQNRGQYVEALRSFLKFKDQFLAIPVQASDDPTEPSWFNGWLPSLDSMALYSILAEHNPRLYLEIGSGNSTKVARRAIRDHNLRTKIVSIDPQPRAECDTLCDSIIRQPFETVDLEPIVASLAPGDVIFLDGSHRAFMNSDTTAFFLDLLPEVPNGSFVQIHDIQLPDDYGPDQTHLFYNEQYLLACWLLGGNETFEIYLPNCFISREPQLHDILNEVWQDPRMVGAEDWGVSFWLRRLSGGGSSGKLAAVRRRMSRRTE